MTQEPINVPRLVQRILQQLKFFYMFMVSYFIQIVFIFDWLILQRPVSTKWSYILKQTCSFQLQNFLDLLVDTRRLMEGFHLLLSTLQGKKVVSFD